MFHEAMPAALQPSLLILVAPFSVSFPLAASATAALRYAGYAQNACADGIAMFLLAFATVAILGLLVRTLYGVFSGELRALSA